MWDMVPSWVRDAALVPRCHNVACLPAHNHLAARLVQGIKQSTAVSLFVVMFFVGHIGRRPRT